ncbi:hypothetical protein EV424DRAFT_1543411 [Suillus variegatus]|nr:hypothetical protein EV424DRAFT_1543411 [Suillus variegatus]
MPKVPNNDLNVVQVVFDPTTSLMDQYDRGRRQQYSRNIAVTGVLQVQPGCHSEPDQFRFYRNPQQGIPEPVVPPCPPRVSFKPILRPRTRRPRPSLTPSLPQIPPPPPPSPPPSLQPHQPASVETATRREEELAYIVAQLSQLEGLGPSVLAQLSDLKWDLTHSGMWSDCVELSELEKS